MDLHKLFCNHNKVQACSMNLVEFREYEGNNFTPLAIYSTEKPVRKDIPRKSEYILSKIIVMEENLYRDHSHSTYSKFFEKLITV